MVYLQVLNSQLATGQGAALVLQNNPANGMPTNTVLSDTVLLPNPPPGSTWLSFNFETPILFGPLEDFHICYGPAPAGNYPGPGWWTHSDNSGVVPARSYYGISTGFQLPSSWTLSSFGDFLIRAGGEYVLPPDPVLSLSDSSITFEECEPGDTSWFNLTVYNIGGGEDLALDSINFTAPTDIFGVTNFIPNMTIAQNDSALLQVFFAPPDSGVYLNIMDIFNNTAVNPATVPLFGCCYYPGVYLTFTPHNPPIIIPSGGGSFTFDCEIENNANEDYIIDIWTDITLSAGGNYPLNTWENINFLSGAFVARYDLQQFVPATAVGGEYSYNGYVRDHFTWELLAMDSFDFIKESPDGSSNHDYGWTLFGWDEDEELTAGNIPSEFKLNPPHPNPFNPTTAISYQLQAASYVELVVYDITGREVATVADGWYNAGAHEVTFDGSGLASGIYFARLSAGGNQSIQKMLLVK